MGEAMGKVFSRISMMRMARFYGGGKTTAKLRCPPGMRLPGGTMKSTPGAWLAFTALAAASAYAQTDVTTTLPSLPGDEQVAAQQEMRTLRTAPDRATPLDLTPRIDVAVGEVPNVRVDPPSNDRRYDTRTQKEWTWQTPQRGTNATGLWPMPSTGGQPGTLQ